MAVWHDMKLFKDFEFSFGADVLHFPSSLENATAEVSILFSEDLWTCLLVLGNSDV